MSIDSLSAYQWIIIVGLLCSIGLSIYALVTVKNLYRRTAVLLHEVDGRTAVQLLNDCVSRLEQMHTDNKELSDSLQRAYEMLHHRVVRPVLHRYNSFDDVGGKQSFSLALVDAAGSGLIISSLHSRQGAAMYAKWIEQGAPAHNLSAEEQQVLEMVLKNDYQVPGTK